MIQTSRDSFPESSSIWLKDMASYLNHLLAFEADDPVFTGKPLGIIDFGSHLLSSV